MQVSLAKVKKNNFFKKTSLQAASPTKFVLKGKAKSTPVGSPVEFKVKDLLGGELKDVKVEFGSFEVALRLQFLPQEQEKKFQALEELVVSDACFMDAFSACCTLLEIDQTAEALVNIFQWHDKTLPLVEWAIKKEVDKTSEKSLLIFLGTINTHFLCRFCCAVVQGTESRSEDLLSIRLQ